MSQEYGKMLRRKRNSLLFHNTRPKQLISHLAPTGTKKAYLTTFLNHTF